MVCLYVQIVILKRKSAVNVKLITFKCFHFQVTGDMCQTLN